MRPLLIISVLVFSAGIAGAESPTTVAPSPAPPPVETSTPDLPATDSPVANIFVHPLLAFPDKAFRPGKNESRMDEWFVTADEFRKALGALLSKGYVLVRPSDVYRVHPNGVEFHVPDLPPGKKPLILSIDDLNYYVYMRSNGTVSRLQVDKNNQLMARTILADGTFRDDLDREVPQILETFLGNHPEFSHLGARGLIGLTGYAGILGWQTQDNKNPNLKSDQAEAKKVVRWLKDRGWEFASHSYAHRTKKSQANNAWTWSEARWKSEVEPLVGPTPFYILPFGETWWRDPYRWKSLRAAGFRVFFGVEKKSNLRWLDGLPIAGRVPLDGRGLRHRFGLLKPFLDPQTIWDPLRPPTMKY